jgi:hypothetical protein
MNRKIELNPQLYRLIGRSQPAPETGEVEKKKLNKQESRISCTISWGCKSNVHSLGCPMLGGGASF